MNAKLLTLLVVVVAIGAVAYYFWPMMAKAPATQSETASQNMGTYAYICDNGVGFTMTPSANMSAVTLKSTTAAPFSEVTLNKQGDGNIYMSNPNDAEFSFEGKGETVTIALGAQTMVCHPVADPDNAPFNWGDAN